eukprot:TRINITY_DN80097_c0_g1_i1.p1 TRINITY_DN80097_c0_g1~~TRINITY_DN80097_c0_g1_i1.p1  ORF type:complete len:304 (-),score=45.03 TRINITY_DN80097_c0_g1_i1:75-986(-)
MWPKRRRLQDDERHDEETAATLPRFRLKRDARLLHEVSRQPDEHTKSEAVKTGHVVIQLQPERVFVNGESFILVRYGNESFGFISEDCLEAIPPLQSTRLAAAYRVRPDSDTKVGEGANVDHQGWSRRLDKQARVHRIGAMPLAMASCGRLRMPVVAENMAWAGYVTLDRTCLEHPEDRGAVVEPVPSAEASDLPAPFRRSADWRFMPSGNSSAAALTEAHRHTSCGNWHEKVEDILKDAAALRSRVEAVKKEEPRPTCKICFDDVADSAFIPCGHVFCGKCIKDVKACHTCRKEGQPFQLFF